MEFLDKHAAIYTSVLSMCLLSASSVSQSPLLFSYFYYYYFLYIVCDWTDDNTAIQYFRYFDRFKCIETKDVVLWCDGECVEPTLSPCCLEMIRSVSQSSLFPTRRSSASSEAYWHKTESREETRQHIISPHFIKVKPDYRNDICSAYCHHDNWFYSTTI